MERSKSVVPSGIRHPSALRLPTIHQSANGFDDGRLNAALLSVVIGGELDELGFILQLEQLNIDVGDGQLQLASNSIQQLIARVVLVDFGHHSTQFLSLLDEGLHHIDAVQDESSSQKQISQFLRSQFAHRLQLRLDPAALPHLQRFDHHLHLGPAVQSISQLNKDKDAVVLSVKYVDLLEQLIGVERSQRPSCQQPRVSGDDLGQLMVDSAF